VLVRDLQSCRELSLLLRGPLGGALVIPTTANLGTSSEFRLLLAASRLRLEDDDRKRIRAITEEGLDWTRVLRLARENRVDSLLHHGLAGAAPEAVPASVAAHLEAYRVSNLARNRRQFAELGKLARAWEGAGIRFLVFKGPVLAARLYGDPGTRFFWDLDVLVRPEDIERAGALLTERGYRLPALSDREKWFATRYHFAYTFEHPDEELEVDLHWRLFPANLAIPLDERGMWERATPCSIAGVDMLTLSSEDTLLHLAVHGAKEEWRRLQMICDVAEYLRCPPAPFDWDTCMARAGQQGAKRALLLAARLAHAGLGAPAPAGVGGVTAADPVVADLERRVWRGLEDPARRTSVFRISRFRRLVHERRLDRARYLLRTATMPRREHVKRFPVPHGLRAAYYVPVRILHDCCLLPIWCLRRLGRQAGPGAPAA
jgi:hypothetical protein